MRLHYKPKDDLDYELDYSGARYDGVGLDADKLENTFIKLGYDILHLRNLLTKDLEILLTPEELIKREGVVPFSNYASLIVCYLGHGSQGAVLGVDYRHNRPVSLNRIQYDAFGDQRCPELSGKPKIFIVLACQGNKEQVIWKKNSNSDITMATSLRGASNTSFENRPILYDFIRLSSTIEEYVSYTSK